MISPNRIVYFVLFSLLLRASALPMTEEAGLDLRSASAVAAAPQVERRCLPWLKICFGGSKKPEGSTGGGKAPEAEVVIGRPNWSESELATPIDGSAGGQTATRKASPRPNGASNKQKSPASRGRRGSKGPAGKKSGNRSNKQARPRRKAKRSLSRR